MYKNRYTYTKIHSSYNYFIYVAIHIVSAILTADFITHCKCELLKHSRINIYKYIYVYI